MQPDETRQATGLVPWNSDDQLEVLVFDLGGQSFALEAVLVREILDTMPETRVPGAPALVGHVINFRGRIIPLADLHLAFGMTLPAPTKDSRIVVIELDLGGDATIIGLRTDKVHEVATFSAATKDSRIVVIELDLDGEPTIIGLRTDKVHEVATFAAATSEDAPVVGLRWKREHVRSLVRHGNDDIVVLPDLGAIFQSITRGDAVAASIH